jgi:hypothetical protein
VKKSHLLKTFERERRDEKERGSKFSNKMAFIFLKIISTPNSYDQINNEM